MDIFIKNNIKKAVSLDKDNSTEHKSLGYFDKKYSEMTQELSEEEEQKISFREALERSYETLIIKRILNFLYDEKEKDYINREENLKRLLRVK